MDVRLALIELGGVARAAELIAAVGRHAVAQAVRRPPRTHIWYRDCSEELVIDGVTEPVRTVIDCARDLPFDEALCVADSALRVGDVTCAQLAQAVDALSGPRSAQARRVVDAASAEAANPLESVLHALCLEVDGLQVQQQVVIRAPGGNATVDLADKALRLVIEAEGYETHGTRSGFDKDCRRYTVLVCRDWLVLRFTWTQVMFEPQWVVTRLREAVALQQLRRDRRNVAATRC